MEKSGKDKLRKNSNLGSSTSGQEENGPLV